MKDKIEAYLKEQRVVASIKYIVGAIMHRINRKCSANAPHAMLQHVPGTIQQFKSHFAAWPRFTT
jgi:hypothetical protein